MTVFAWTFEGGTKVIVKSAAPIAGNVATTKTCPAGKRWKLLNISVALTTDGTVVNRTVTIYKRDAAASIVFMNIASVQAESLGPLYKYFTIGAGTVGGTINELGTNLLDPTDDVYIAIGAGVAGDSYDYVVEYLEIDI